MLSSVSGRDKKDDYQTMTTTATVESANANSIQPPEPVFRADITGGQAVTSGQGDGQRDDMESMESGGSVRMIIRTTKHWSVRYEDE